jgi:hypothetical protein
MPKNKKERAAENALTSSGDGTGFPPDLLSATGPPKLPFRPPGILLKDHIWVLEGFLSENECRSWIDFMNGNTNVKLDYIKQRGTRYLASRECSRYHRDDPVLAQRLFDRFQNALLCKEIRQGSICSIGAGIRS